MNIQFMSVVLLLAWVASGCTNPTTEDLKKDRTNDVDIHVDSGRRSADQGEVLAELRNLRGDIGNVDTKVGDVSNRIDKVEERMGKLENMAIAPAQAQAQLPLNATLAAATHMTQMREALGIDTAHQRIDAVNQQAGAQISALENRITGMVIDKERERADDADRRAAEAEFQLKIIEGKTYVEQASLHQHFQAPGCAVIDPVYGSLREFYATESVWRGGLYPGRYGGYYWP